jgi:hypothetical protein
MTTGLTSTGFVAAQTSDIVTSLQNDELATIDPALNLAATQPLGQINGIHAAALANVWALLAAIYAALDPDAAVGVQLDNLCALTGVVRLPATATLVTCTVTLAAGTYNAGTLKANISGYPQYTFTNQSTIVAPGGALTGQIFVATVTGPIVCNSTTLTVITNAVAGWSAITNPTNGTTGTNVETDTALRLRRSQSLVASGGSTIDAIRATLLNPLLVPNMIAATVLENNTLVNDSNAQPGKSFQAVIWDNNLATNASIAQAIWNTKPSGIQAFGSTAANATDATGKTQSVSFTRVSSVRTYYAITVKTNPLLYPTGGASAVATLVQNAFVAYGAALLPGQTIIALALEAAALSCASVTDVTSFTLDIVFAPVGTTNLLMTVFQIGTIALADVVVTVT